MPYNLLKKYPDLLDLNMSEEECLKSLKLIFKRDIEDNSNLNFRTKKIRPVKGEEPSMQLLFNHLTKEEIEVVEDKTAYKRRQYEKSRSERLHWIKPHLNEVTEINPISIFSCVERDIKKRKDICRTYLYNEAKKYIIVLEPQRSNQDYYLLTAYFLNKDYGEKKIKKLMKKKLDYVV